MAEQGKNRRWIVLLNKAPKGPFSAEEIRELLAQGILRRNDLASAIEETPTKKGEWKLLWQFTEFDRRAVDAITNTPINGAAGSINVDKKKAEDRRKAAAAEELRQKALSELPENWKDIQPEDLLPHSTSVINDTDYEIPAESLNRGFDDFGRPRSHLYYGAGFAALAAVGYFVFVSAPKAPEVVSTPKPMASQPKQPVEVPRRLPAQSRPAPASAATAAPTARPRIPSDANIEDYRDADQGEVDPIEEEIRSQEARAAKKTEIKPKRGSKASREDGEEEVANEDGEEGDEQIAQDRERDRGDGDREEREPAEDGYEEPEEER